MIGGESMILVSMCLIGLNCNYKGESKPNEKVIQLLKAGKVIPICPEQLGGLPTPRSGARIVGGNGEDVLEGKAKLITDNGEDVTEQYLKGAYETLRLCKMLNVKAVILKQGSPSCGNRKTQGGVHERRTVEGMGVTAALLKRNGIKVYSEEDLDNPFIFEEISRM